MYKREPLPYYGGLVSFFRSPGIEIEEVTEGLAVVAGVPIDNGMPFGRAGTRFGPRAIREASLGGGSASSATTDEERTTVDLVSGTARRLKDKPEVADLGDFNIYPTDLMKTTESVIRRNVGGGQARWLSRRDGRGPLRDVSVVCGVRQGDGGANAQRSPGLHPYRQSHGLLGRHGLRWAAVTTTGPWCGV